MSLQIEQNVFSSPFERTGNKAENPLEVVHLDWKGPSNPPTEDDKRFSLVVSGEPLFSMMLPFSGQMLMRERKGEG
jgi:hypothetical protein